MFAIINFYFYNKNYYNTFLNLALANFMNTVFAFSSNDRHGLFNMIFYTFLFTVI